MKLPSFMRATRLVLPLFLASLTPFSTAAAQSVPAPSSQELFRLLEFTVQERGDLRFVGRERGTLKMREPRGDAAAATALLDVVNSPDLDDERSQSAVQRRIREREGVSGVSVRAERPLTIDGVAGYEVVASAADSVTGEPLLLYHAVLPTMRSLVFFEGRVGASRGQRFLPQFRSVVESFQRTGVVRASTGGVRYEVAGGYQPVPEQSDERVAVFRQESTSSGLFLTTLPKDADRESRLREVLRRVPGAAVPDEPQSFRWLEPPGRPGSPAGSGREAYQGSNGRTVLIVSVHELRQKEQTILAGYYFRASHGAEAAALRGRYVAYAMDSYPAGEAFAWLVRSIFGEERARNFGPPAFTGIGALQTR